MPELTGTASPARSNTPRTSGHPEGIVIVDKPGSWTSHDVVARIRRLAGTRRVGHAGTLDPMATGVLVVGIGRATRMLGYIGGSDKTYAATIRLGWSTVTDDAEGVRVGGSGPGDVDESAIAAAVAALTGPIAQRPSAVSAIKVGGRRSHDRVRSGEEVHLAERPVTVWRFDIVDLRRRPDPECIDLDVLVTCSSGTYVRALARDLGAALGVGGHLTALRRTRVGAFDLDRARSLEDLAQDLAVMDMAAAARACFASVVLTEADANAVRHGRSIELGAAWARARHPDTSRLPGTEQSPSRASAEVVTNLPESSAVHALFTADGQFLALARPKPDGSSDYLAVFAQP